MVVLILIIGFLLCAVLFLIALYYLKYSEVKITDKAVDISKVIPIQTITEDSVINGNGDISIGYQMLLPEVFSTSQNEVDHIHERLEGLFKMLPAGTVIHQQNFYYTNEYRNEDYSTNPLILENLMNYNGREVLCSYTNLYLTFVNTDVKQKVRRSPNSTSLMRKMNFPFKQPFKGYDEKLEEMESIILNFEQGLNSITKFEIKRMNSQELNNAVFDYLNLSYDRPTQDATAETLNPLMTDHQGNMKIGNKNIAVLSLTREGEFLHEHARPNTGKSKAYGTKVELPENIRSKCSMIYPVGLGLPFNHIVNIIIEVTDTDSTISVINAEKQALNYIAPFYPPAKEKQIEQETFCNEVGKFEYQTAYTAFNIIIDDVDKGSLTRKISLTQQGYSFMNQSACYIENAELANLFFCGIPGNARANYRGFVNTTKQALCYLQKDNLYISDLKGHIFSDRFGNPSKIDLWDSPYLVNRNRIVIGPSGSGKSFWLNEYILQSYAKENDIVIIDIGGSYKSMISLNKGKYFDSTNTKTFAFNPFLCEQDRNGKYIYLDTEDDESQDDLITILQSIISYIWKENQPITPTEKAILYESIVGFYKYVNSLSKPIKPNLIEYRRYLIEVFGQKMSNFEQRNFEVEELALLLRPYTEGDLKFLLNAEENIDIVNDKLIAFDMEDVSKKSYFPLVAIITLQMVADKIKRRKGVNKELIIDEGLDFLRDEKFGTFIAYLYRTFRKKQGSITLAAQNVLFLKNIPSEIKDSIIINCATKILLDHSEHRENLPDVKNILSIDDEGISMIESLQKKDKWREFFIVLGKEKFVFRHGVSDFASAAYDSRQDTVVRIQQLFKETGSTYTAIKLYLEERIKQYN